jgi:hypothetical protein
MRLLIVILAMTAACTDGGRPLVIRNNLAPEEGCTFTVNSTAGAITRGRIDTQAADGYLFAALVENDAESGTGSDSQRRALIEGADVELSFPANVEEMFADNEDFADDRAFTQFFSGVVEPDGGKSYFTFVILPKQFMTNYLGFIGAGSTLEVTARIVLFGQLGGGSTESIPFNYTIDVCNGCMTVDLGACSDLPEDFEGSPGGICNTLQDVPLECCDGNNVCPAVPPPPT